jgi:hypothetical protein
MTVPPAPSLGAPGRLIIVFDDESTMTVKTATLAPAIMVKAILEDGRECILQFEDGASVTLHGALQSVPV